MVPSSLLRVPRRVAMISVHTSPLDQPGSGDAGGMNVYIAEVARRLAARGTAVEVFTRSTAADQPPTVALAAGVQVHNIVAGPAAHLAKEDLPSQLCAMTAGVLRRAAARGEDRFDLVHSHYWLSGQVGWLAKESWGVPMVHTMHTLGRVKNARLAPHDRPEPMTRIIGEQQVVQVADLLVANAPAERDDLIHLYGADPARVEVVTPGVDLDVFGDRDRSQARAALGYRPDERVVLFVGRVQPLKAPDVLIKAAHELGVLDPTLAARTRLVLIGGPSGSGHEQPAALAELAARLGVTAAFLPAMHRDALALHYAAADVLAVPSHSESFGLVALEAQASGTPVLASRVGGLPTAVVDGVSGLLVDGHDPRVWAGHLRRILADDGLRASLAEGALRHASGLSWEAAADRLLGCFARVLAPRQDLLDDAVPA